MIDRACEPLEASGYVVPLYNLACCEALSGRRGTRSLTFAAPSRGARALRDLAKEDTDFDPLRDEPAFRELVG